MKKLLALAGVATLLLAVTSCGKKSEKPDSDSIQIALLSQQYNEATTFNDSLMLLMGDIYAGLDSINMQEGLLYAQGGDNADRRAEIRENLNNIKSRLAANRNLLADMEKRLKASGNENAVLTRTIAQLKSTISTQETRIAQLEGDLNKTKEQLAEAHTQIGTLNTRVGELNTQVEETKEQVKVETAAKEQAQQETIAVENEANKVFYCIGTNKELKNNGLLEKKFLGSTKVMKGNYNANYFTQADRRNVSVINCNSKKVKIWSNMPADSYQIVQGADGMKSIHITNPQKFWSLTPYLVIQID